MIIIVNNQNIKNENKKFKSVVLNATMEFRHHGIIISSMNNIFILRLAKDYI